MQRILGEWKGKRGVCRLSSSENILSLLSEIKGVQIQDVRFYTHLYTEMRWLKVASARGLFSSKHQNEIKINQYRHEKSTMNALPSGVCV